MSKYHPNNSRVGASSLNEFIRKPITGNLQEVPGIADKTEEILKENEISTTYQLIAKYLSFKEEAVGPIEHTDRFYYWLQSIQTPGGHRAGVVRSIAEKMNIVFAGIYDPDAYEIPEDEEDEHK